MSWSPTAMVIGIREITPVYDVLSTQPYLNWL